MDNSESKSFLVARRLMLKRRLKKIASKLLTIQFLIKITNKRGKHVSRKLEWDFNEAMN